MANRSPRLNLTNTSTAMQPLQSKNVQVQRRWPTLPCKSSKERPRLSQATRFTVSAPAVQKCSSTEEVAYTSLQIFQGETKIESSDKIHCVCPDGHNYLDTEYKFREDGEISEMLVNYFCLPLPACNASEVCKDVTVKPGQYIVNPKCLCENGLACPSVTKKGVTKTLLGANMELQQITCQKPMGATGHRLADLYAPQQLAQLYRYRKHFGHQK